MKTLQFVLREVIQQEELKTLTAFLADENFLCLAFFGKEQSFLLKNLDLLIDRFPNGNFVGCSSAGHVATSLVYDQEIVLTFIKFSKVKFKVNIFENLNAEQSENIGLEISKAIPESHKSAMILSEGLNVNGSRLVLGLKNQRPDVNYFGGLSADGYDFKETYVLSGKKIFKNSIVIVSFDNNLKVKSSVGGGWNTFGIERTVTKSVNNIVYEIDHKAAIDLYDDFLGEKKVLLPSYGLHFPIFLESEKIVRTLLAVDRDSKSLTFAGDVPEMSKIKLMRSSPESLIQSALNAVEILNPLTKNDSLYFMVSCVGRRLVLGEKVEDECEGLINKNDTMTGFYSYGEINSIDTDCKLHNQTYTLTRIYEDE